MELSYNTNAIQLLEKNRDRIYWNDLSYNPNAIQLLEKNRDRANWNGLSANPSIFEKTLNYKYLKERMDMIREELMMKCMHPKRLERWLEMGGEIDDF